MVEQLDNWQKWGEIWHENEIWEVMNGIEVNMVMINDNDSSNPYDKSNDNKK